MKCQTCGHYRDPSTLIPHNCYLEMLEHGELPPPVPEEARYSDYPDQYDLAGFPRTSGKAYLINTRVEVKPSCEYSFLYCKCEQCQYIMGLSWALPDKKLMENFMSIFTEEVIAEHCPFCGPDGACGYDHCPYTQEKK